MKRKLTLFLSAVMVASSLPMTAYAANFKDINDVPWDGVQSVINSVADKGLLGGYEDNTFRARNNVTYCEAMQMVYKTMTKSGMTEPVSAVDIYSYTATLNSLKVPVWAHTAVAYGLKNGVIDLQFVAQKFGNNGSQVATREDVAYIFGNALTPAFGKEKEVTSAKTFADYWSISAERLEQVDILKRLNILAGDEYGRFNPKKNINRAEMAVMLNKTYNILTEGVNTSGEIVDIYVNDDKYYSFTIELDNGGKEYYQATEGEIPVYAGNTSEKISMSKLSEGDKVVVAISGGKLFAIRQMDTISAQEKYDVTGYIYSYSDNTLILENENTGETDDYTVDNSTTWYLDGKHITRGQMKNELESHINQHAYAGLNLEVKRERVGVGQYQDVIYVNDVYVTFTDGYTVTGEVKTFTEKSISLKLSGVSASKDYILADGCALYLGENKATLSEAKKLVASGTTFAKVDIDNKEKATKIIFSEDTFGTGVTYDDSLSERYTVTGFTEKKMGLKDGSEKITYEFGSENPVSGIAFYVWENNEWSDVGVGTAELYVNDPAGDSGVYCKVATNRGGKLTEVYLSYSKDAWQNTTEFQNDKKGTVVSLVDEVLKFKTGTAGYKLLTEYESGELAIKGAFTNSKKLLTNLANDKDVELYAEISADSRNRALTINAEIKKITGSLLEYDRDSSPIYLRIQTADGNEFKVKAAKFLKITNDEDMTAEKLASSKYNGSKITVQFNASGSIDKVTILDNSHQKVEDYVTGAAVSTTDRELTLEGKSTKYVWRAEDATEYTNYSMSTTSSLYKLKDLINDKDTKVSVKLRPDENNRIDEIDVYVTAAKGTFGHYDEDRNLVRIKTADGNTFTFDVVSRPTIDVDDATEGILNRVAEGKTIKLTFNNNGKVTKIEKA